MSDLERVMRLIKDLQARIDKKPSLWIASVTSITPLRVQLDMSPTNFPGTPRTLIASPGLGDRVIVAIQDRRMTIIGRLGG